MRLVCPNCEAKYEVPDDAIPDTGRDVQCASCGHAWFQMRAKPATAAQPAGDDAQPASQAVQAAEAPEAALVPVQPQAEAAAEAVPEAGALQPKQSAAKADEPALTQAASVEASPTEADEADTEPKPTPTDEAKAEPASDAAARKPAAAAYAVDESVLAILREEAEREAVARRAEASPLETQTSLGLDTAIPSASAAAKSAAAQSSGGETETDAKPTARRDLLPDVEEINSTLRPSEVALDEASDEVAASTREGRGGFRNGFLLVMAVAILGAAVYIGAPRLSAIVPSLAQPLTAYVGAVEGLRLRLDGLMRSATVAINGD